MNENMSVRIGKKAFLNSFFILFGLIIFSGILTRILPMGAYERVFEDGRQMIVPGSFVFTDGVPLAIYRWFTAPVGVLFGPDGGAVVSIVLIILGIGGLFSMLDKFGILGSIISKIVHKFKDNKYILLRILILVFMLFGSLFGMFEEIVALVPICIALAYSFRWDAYVGLGFSVLATGFGFAGATFNPFTLGIAQRVAELPLFSGLELRVIYFIVMYLLFSAILVRYAKKIEANPEVSTVYEEDKGLREKYSQGFTPPPVSRGVGKAFKTFLSGMAGISPSIILILMAASIKHIITEGMIMDTLLYYAQSSISSTSPYVSVTIIYLMVMLLNIFIVSGSAKALLIMPIIAGLSDFVGVTRQTMVMAYCFGDGFSNMLYPTNPVLMIALSLTVISYTKWLRWVMKMQIMAFAISLVFLFIGVAIGYGPF